MTPIRGCVEWKVQWHWSKYQGSIQFVWLCCMKQKMEYKINYEKPLPLTPWIKIRYPYSKSTEHDIGEPSHGHFHPTSWHIHSFFPELYSCADPAWPPAWWYGGGDWLIGFSKSLVLSRILWALLPICDSWPEYPCWGWLWDWFERLCFLSSWSLTALCILC